jgi:hypothetical protein
MVNAALPNEWKKKAGGDGLIASREVVPFCARQDASARSGREVCGGTRIRYLCGVKFADGREEVL